MLVAPNWGKRNSEVIQFITNKLEENDTWQGKFFKKM
jgi:radical SAM superfamily enzyme